MGQKRSVAIIGGTIWGNRGAEAMLVTAIGQVRQHNPDAEIYMFSYLPKTDRKLVQDQSIHILDARPQALVLGHFPFAVLASFFQLFGIKLPDAFLSRSVRALRQCDVLMDVSGIAFADGREIFLPFNILIIWPAILLKVPVVKLAQAVGPFKNPINRIVSRIFLRMCYKLYARGKITAQLIEKLGIPYQLAADVAFLYQPEYSLSSENPGKVDTLEKEIKAVKESGKIFIGLLPSSLVYEKSEEQGRDYAGQFIKLIESLDENYHFVLIPNATREGSDKPRNNDLYVIDVIRQKLSSAQAQQVHIVDFDLNTEGSRRLIQLCDLTVTSRFHGMVSSLSLKVPVVVIGWSHKYAEVLEMFDMEQYAVDFGDPNLDMQALVHTMLENRDDLQAGMAKSLEQVQQLSKNQFDTIGNLLN